MKGTPSLGPCPRTQVILATDIWLGLMVDLVPSLRSSASSCHGDGTVVTNSPGVAFPTPLHPIPAVPTSFSVTNSASSPTRSPAWGISFSMRGMKVAWHLRCFRAREASASRTLASMGFLTEGKKRGKKKGKELSGVVVAAPASLSLPRRHFHARHSLTRLYLALRFLRA